MARIDGTSDDDTLVGQSSGDSIYGADGNDLITSAGSSTLVFGGNGNDTIVGDGSSNILRGEAGNDVITGGGSSNTLYGGTGDDDLTAGGSSNVLYGEAGDDTLDTGDSGSSTLNGADGDDVYQISVANASSSNQFTAFVDDSGGDDVLDLSSLVESGSQLSFAGSFDLLIYVSDADGNRIGTITVDDHFYSSNGIETLVIGDQTYSISDTSARDLTSRIAYGATDGNDTIVGGSGRDTIDGFSGDDVIIASEGQYSRVYGGNGDDDITANGDGQRLFGENGDDTLSTGDNDNASLYGGLGDDSYVIEWASASENDTFYTYISENIYTGDAGNDVLDLSAIASSLDNLTFAGSSWDLTIYVNDDDGNRIGTVYVDDQFWSSYDRDIETLVVGDDTIALTEASSGNELNSILKYGAGANNDLITLTSDNESVFGFAGDDTIIGGGDNNLLYGGEGNDSLTAGGDQNSLFGEAGNDTLQSGDNNNVYLYGGFGDDLYVVNWESADSIFTNISEDVYSTEGGSDTLDLSAIAGSLDNLTFVGSGWNLDINVSDDEGNFVGTVRVTGQYWSSYDRQVETLIVGDDTLDLTQATSGDQLNSVVKYGAGANGDLIEVSNDDLSVFGLGGDDTITSTGSNNTIYGDDGDDVLTVSGSSFIYGGAGNDTLTVDGGDGDFLHGGFGDDLYVVSWDGASCDDQFQTTLSSGFSGANGDDTLDLSAIADSVDNLSFGGNFGWGLNIYVHDDNGDRIGTILINNQFYPWSGSGGDSIETIILGNETIDISDATSAGYLNSVYTYGASSNDDVITGNGDSEQIYGLEGDDTLTGGGEWVTLFGGDGNDLLTSGGARNTLYGGNGDDTLSSGDFTSTVFYGEDGDDTYVIDWESASTSNYFNATIYENQYSSNYGSNTLDLSNIADSVEDLEFFATSSSFSSLSIYLLDDDGERTGVISINSQFNWNGYAVDTLILGDETVDLTQYETGSELLSELQYGTSANDDDIEIDDAGVVILMFDGDDTATVTGSSTWVYGGEGNDTLTVDADYGRAFGDEGDDALAAESNRSYAILYGGEGNDSLASGSYYGSMFAGEGDDSLETSATYQWMYGGSDDDTYVISWTATSGNTARVYDNNSTSDSGTDTLDLTNVADSFENVSFATVGSSDLYVYVRDDNNNLIGTIIIDDHFWTFWDEKVEYLRIGDQTFDLSNATASTDLNAELAARTGNTSENLSGSADADVMSGFGGDDVMNGGAGNDKVSGDRGSDTLYGAEGDDTLIGGTQSDLLDGGNGADNLLGGNGNDTVRGGSGVDTLSGSVGDDSLHGGGGGDRLFGDSGADTLNGAGGGDRVDYLRDTADLLVDLETGEVSGGFAEGDVLIGIESVFGGKGNDTLRALEDGSRLNGAGGDDLIVGRGGDDLLAGGNDNDTVEGGAGNDLMNGNRGDDTLIGGAGDDTMRGSAGSDTFVFAEGSDDDEIVDFRSNDLLDLSETATDFADLDDVLAAATETADGLLIDLGAGDSVLLAGASLTSLTDDNLVL